MKRHLVTIKQFLNRLHENEDIPINYAYIIPTILYDSKDKIPSAFSNEDIKNLLSCIDRGNPTGKRDYAMILLATHLGLRASDICKMKFNEIKWELNMIELVQEKTSERVVLPLLSEVGNAIIDYIRYGRPKNDTDTIFLRHVAPITSMSITGLYYSVNKYMAMAKVSIPPGKKHGPHSLRHSLASSLLEGDIPISVISKVLGHKDIKMTSVYLKIDIKQLRNCALEVPKLSRNRGDNHE
jgi:site-specific recombinase XerD